MKRANATNAKFLLVELQMAFVFKARNKSKSKLTKIKSTYDRLSHKIIKMKKKMKEKIL